MSQTLVTRGQTGITNQMYLFNGNGITYTPLVADELHYLTLYPLAHPTAYYINTDDFQHIAGEQTAFNSVADNGSGKCRFYVAAGHPYANGDPIQIYGSVLEYNINDYVQYVDSTHFDTTSTFTATANGLIFRPNRLKCLIPPYYKHKISYTCYMRPTQDAATIDVQLQTRSGLIVGSNISHTFADHTVFYHARMTPIEDYVAQNDEIFFAFATDDITSNILFASLIVNIERVL